MPAPPTAEVKGPTQITRRYYWSDDEEEEEGATSDVGEGPSYSARGRGENEERGVSGSAVGGNKAMEVVREETRVRKTRRPRIRLTRYYAEKKRRLGGVYGGAFVGVEKMWIVL